MLSTAMTHTYWTAFFCNFFLTVVSIDSNIVTINRNKKDRRNYMILVIDNYDSFTYNVVQALQRLGNEEVKVVRSKEITVEEIEKLAPSRLVVSPGPGTPSEAGVSEDAIKYFAGKIPILGVCLGHQAIGEAFGATIVQAKRICHGVVEEMTTDGRGLFRIVGKKSTFTRYHSLVIDEATLPPEFEVTARAADGDIMGIRHKTMMIEGVQFHPESIASQAGDDIFRAFLNYRRENLPVSEILNQIVEKKDLTEDQSCLFMENLAVFFKVSRNVLRYRCNAMFISFAENMQKGAAILFLYKILHFEIKYFAFPTSTVIYKRKEEKISKPSSFSSVRKIKKHIHLFNCKPYKVFFSLIYIITNIKYFPDNRKIFWMRVDKISAE